MNRVTKIVIIVLALAFVVIPMVFVSAAAAPSSLAPAKHYSKGTICGNAQAGPWSASWVGKSSFQGFYSVFGINNMVLSGGNSGSVTSTSGYLKVYNHQGGTLLLNATYSGLSGTYVISGSKMKLQHFEASTVKVYFNHISGHGKDHRVHSGTYHNAHIPAQTLACTTNEQYVS